MTLHDELAHRFMTLHDTKLVDCLALGTHRHHRSSERSGSVALHNLSQGIVSEHVTISNQSHSSVLYLLLLTFFSSLLHLLTYFNSNSQMTVVSRGLSVIFTLYSTSCILITDISGTIRFPCRGLFYDLCCDLRLFPRDHLCCVLNLSSSLKPSEKLFVQVEIIEYDSASTS